MKEGLTFTASGRLSKELEKKRAGHELVDRDSRTIMNIENKGQYPSFDLFVKLITMFDVSVDQFIHADGGARSSSCRKHIDVLLNSMNEKELVVIETTAEGIKKARETEVPE